MEKSIKTILRESFVDEKEESGQSTDEPVSSSKAQYDRIYHLLQNNIFNHAEIIEKLWGNRNATNRSLFRKKLNKMKTQGGDSNYEFTGEELTKIAGIMLDTSADIKKHIGKKENEKE